MTPEIRHGGCYDCGNDTQEILKSVTATREVTNPKTGKASKQTGGIALCDSCYKKEIGGKI